MPTDPVAAMDRVLPATVFDRITFADVVQFLRDVTQQNYYVNWGALEAVGVSRNTPISLQLKGVTLRQTLELIVDEAGCGSTVVGYEIVDNVIRISATETLSQRTPPRSPKQSIAPATITLSYDIRELLAQNAQSAAADVSNAHRELEREQRTETIVRMIEDTVSPDSWFDNGGEPGDIRAIDGVLFVTHTTDCHKRIFDVLDTLRVGLALPPRTQSQEKDSPGEKHPQPANPPQHKGKKRGRKIKFDPQKDEKLCVDYKASGMRAIKEFARQRGLKYADVDAALKRVRGRRSRNNTPPVKPNLN